MDTIRSIHQVLRMCRDYDLRDNPTGGIYSLLQAAYMKTYRVKTSGINEAEFFYVLSRSFARSLS